MNRSTETDLVVLLDNPPESLDALLAAINPAIYSKLQTATALGRWEDGQRLEQAQLEQCMQLIILYEAQHLPAAERTGAPLSKQCGSRSSESLHERPANNGIKRNSQ